MKKLLFLLPIFLCFSFATLEKPSLKMGLVKYNGGGDWYSNPTALPNLAKFCNDKLGTNFDPDYGTVEVGSAEIFDFAFLQENYHSSSLLL